MNSGMPPEDRLILAHKRSLRLIRKADDPNVRLIGAFGLSQDEMMPDVRAVYGDARGFRALFTLWTNIDEIIAISGSDPAALENPAMLILHERDIHRLQQRGINLDIKEMSRSPSYPDWFFKLLAFTGEDHLVHILTKVVIETDQLRHSA